MSQEEIVIKTGENITQEEIDAVNTAKAREWNLAPMSEHQIKISTYFLLKNERGELLSQCQVVDVGLVKFNGETFYPLGIGGMISTVEGQGYGKEILIAIRQYLKEKNKTGIGFCREDVKDYYQKCGFNIDDQNLPRFVFYQGNQKNTNKKERYIFYQDGEDHFMGKVIAHPGVEVLLSREPDW